jgi:hypothetical protein
MKTHDDIVHALPVHPEHLMQQRSNDPIIIMPSNVMPLVVRAGILLCVVARGIESRDMHASSSIAYCQSVKRF